MATLFPTFIDVEDGVTPPPGTPDVDAAYLNSVNNAINTVENAMPTKADSASLHTVATSGAYTDLIGTPFIPDSADDIGAQPAGSYAAAGHTHVVGDLTATGTPDATTYLRGDGTWSVPPGDAGGGAVDSVNGQTGVVVLDAADVGAAAVAAPGDYPKPIGTSNVVGTSLDAAHADHVHRLDTADRALLDSVTSKADAAHTHALTDLVTTGTPDGTKYLRDDGVWATPSLVALTRTVAYSATPTIDPTLAGDRINITATGDITTLAVSPTGAHDGQVLQLIVLASGAERAVTFSPAIRTTTGVGRGPHAIVSGQLLRAAVEFSTLTGAWALLAVAVTAG